VVGWVLGGWLPEQKLTQNWSYFLTVIRLDSPSPIPRVGVAQAQPSSVLLTKTTYYEKTGSQLLKSKRI
jgi:hypothetical protein